MKNISEINRNLDAIRQTRHITNAMYLLSVSTMRRGMAGIADNRSYMHAVSASVQNIIRCSPTLHHPLLDGDGYTGKRDTALFVIASDKSLCGAYNQNIAAVTEARIAEIAAEGRETIVYTAGLKMAELLRGHGVEVYKNFDEASSYLSMLHAYRIAEEMIDIFQCGYVQNIELIFTEYVSAADQPVRIRQMLPLKAEITESAELTQMTYEPSADAVLEAVVSQYMQGYIYGSLCNALVCENMARMAAMQSATKNADEMLKSLENAYNAARQLAITGELTEIAAATELIQNAI